MLVVCIPGLTGARDRSESLQWGSGPVSMLANNKFLRCTHAKHAEMLNIKRGERTERNNVHCARWIFVAFCQHHDYKVENETRPRETVYCRGCVYEPRQSGFDRQARPVRGRKKPAASRHARSRVSSCRTTSLLISGSLTRVDSLKESSLATTKWRCRHTSIKADIALLAAESKQNALF